MIAKNARESCYACFQMHKAVDTGYTKRFGLTKARNGHQGQKA